MIKDTKMIQVHEESPPTLPLPAVMLLLAEHSKEDAQNSEICGQ